METRGQPEASSPDDRPDEDWPTASDPADVAIVGGGPIGLELGIRLRAEGIRTFQLEAGPIGATIQWWAPETRFFSSPERIAIAGVPIPSVDQAKATRETYLAYLRAVVLQFGLPVRAWHRVERIDGGRDVDGGFRLTVRPSMHGVGGPAEWQRTMRRASSSSSAAAASTSEPQDASSDAGPARIAHARRVVLAIGDMHRPRLLGIPGEDRPHVSHWFEEPHQCFGRRVLVVGGRNSAVEAALRLHRAGVPVAISYRGDAFDPKSVKYWLRPEIEWLIDKGRIGWHPRTVPVRIADDHVELGPATPTPQDGSRVEPAKPTEPAELADPAAPPHGVLADRVFLLTGYRQDPSLFEQVGVRLEGAERTPSFERSTMETNVPGVFVAGTACGGSQPRTRYYIENSHVHVDRIARAITGRDTPPVADPDYAALEES